MRTHVLARIRVGLRRQQAPLPTDLPTARAKRDFFPPDKTPTTKIQRRRPVTRVLCAVYKRRAPAAAAFASIATALGAAPGQTEQTRIWSCSEREYSADDAFSKHSLSRTPMFLD